MSKEVPAKELAKAEAYVTGIGGRTVRLKLPDGRDIPLCTCTYGDNSPKLKEVLAEIIKRLWNKSFEGQP